MYYFSHRIIILYCLVSLSASLGFSQDTKNSGNWNELKLDISTAEDAISIFGKPLKDKDKVSLKEELELGNWLSKKSFDKIFRVIEYKKLRGSEKVRFAFLENKLAIIILETPNALTETNYFAPDDLEKVFSTKFKPWKWTFGRKLPNLQDFQDKSPDELKKDEYSYWYSLIGIADTCFIATRIDNYKNIEGIIDRHKTENNRRKEINANRKYPGFVEGIQIISRTLELRN